MRVVVPSFAKINLDLRVLHQRPDKFHELRTIFQTISLHDTLTIEFEKARKTEIQIDSSVAIPDNLVVQAAHVALDALKLRAKLHFALRKRIPMGAGLGGGSSNAAAVLLAMQSIAGLSEETAFRLAGQLGSDVPFFLTGGAAVGVGRGTELYDLADLPSHSALVIASGIHVSTAGAYRALKRALTSPDDSLILREFQVIVRALHRASLADLPLKNDFEAPVVRAHPELALLLRKLKRLGARPVRMTGSGSALFALFRSGTEARIATEQFPTGMAFPVRFIGRKEYRRRWRRALGGDQSIDVST